jgi:hypothetical protein
MFNSDILVLKYLVSQKLTQKYKHYEEYRELSKDVTVPKMKDLLDNILESRGVISEANDQLREDVAFGLG